MSDKNMTKIEAALARAEKAIAEAREASARTDQAIDRAQEAIDRFWANQEDRFWANQEKETEAKAADNASCKCSCKDSESPIDPELLMELVADLILLAGRMDEQIQAIERRTRRQKRTRRSAGRFVPPPAF